VLLRGGRSDAETRELTPPDCLTLTPTEIRPDTQTLRGYARADSRPRIESA
jgi:hypothetical protein